MAVPGPLGAGLTGKLPPGLAGIRFPRLPVGRQRSSMLPGMLILGLILFGMVVGAGAQLILGRRARGIDWTLAFVAGLVGSFIGGLLISLLSGDGLALRP